MKKKKQTRTKKRIKKRSTKHFSLIEPLKKMWRRKSYLGLAAIAFVVIALVSGSTYAWFTAADSKENAFKTDFKYKVDLVDKFTPPTETDIDKPISKEVSVTNTGDIAAFVRVMAFPVITSKDNVVLPVTDQIQISYGNLNETDWKNGNDGYFYYLKKLNPGEETPLLFDSVTVSKPISDDYDGASFKIEVKSETVDARKNAYRESFWQTARDTAQTDDPLKTIDASWQIESGS